ncbi:oxygen-independent coproporphyrinogen-III oxidase 1 [bacterium BMS3Abin04]|nr:oxygen-independent coproporphyrinogen-III oxidase 1 [bacterium BMS3Abin04]
MKDISIYIHIPFCDHKCIYCDFYSLITLENQELFLDALQREISYYASDYSPGRNVKTIFFGGGTPSLMSVSYINQILENIKSHFSVNPNVEITLETNPGTVDNSKLQGFKDIGINRLSIGIQSFHQDDLEFLTRIHNRKTAIDTVNNAAAIGFNDISIDLIFNLPKQTKKKWTENLYEALSLPITHISTYSLILERGTILNKLVLDGKIKIGDNDFDADLYDSTIKILTKNRFVQYEVSNFCKPGFESKHNLNYWKHGDYLSFGTASHSFVNSKRWWNYSSLKHYIKEVFENGNATRGFEILSDKQKLEEYVMLAFRSNGIDLNEMFSIFGNSWYKNNFEKLSGLIKNGFLSRSNGILKLTSKGYSVCDEIVLQLI